MAEYFVQIIMIVFHDWNISLVFLNRKRFVSFIVCLLSSTFGGHNSTAFITEGFDDWKKALESKRGFAKHQDSKFLITAKKNLR